MGEVLELADAQAREAALADAQLWSERVELSRKSYGEALDTCQKLGIPHTKIARRLGKSEAAIRRHLKRRNDQ